MDTQKIEFYINGFILEWELCSCLVGKSTKVKALLSFPEH